MNCTKMNLHSIWAYAYAQILNWRAKNQSGPTQNEVATGNGINCTKMKNDVHASLYEHMPKNLKILKFEQLLKTVFSSLGGS